jgi:cyclopropane fatty-acyl-phospholipid synthase-like methyltransferase
MESMTNIPLNLVKVGHCPLCKIPAAPKLLFQLEKFGVYQCPCGHKFIDPSLDGLSQIEIYRSSETLKQINPALEHYYEYETLDPKSLTCADYTRALDEVSRLSPGRRLLEVGCGTGSFLDYARTKDWSVHGVDSSHENIAKLRERGVEGEACGFLDFQSRDQFDVIVLWDLIEHPQDPGAFLDKSRELLKTGGLLLIATPLDPNILTLLAGAMYALSGGRINAPLNQLYIIEHTSYFSLKTLSHLLGQHGFGVSKAWKTETDLARYHFSKPLQFALHAAFLIARCLHLQNRLITIARKN